ncbi:MAG: peptidase S41 protein, partial [Chryseobacterium sp.]
MRKFIFTGFLFISLMPLEAQKGKTSQDSITIFYNQLFNHLENSYLHKNEVNWKEVKAETKINLAKYDRFESSLGEIKSLFDQIKADHCSVYYRDRKYGGSTKSISSEVSEAWKIKYKSKPEAEVKILEGDIGYILMPKIVFSTVNEKNTHAAAQPIYNKIANIKINQQIKGWVIDLRLNSGGNSAPMLLALYDFLGNNPIWSSVNLKGKKVSTINLDQGVYYDNGIKQGFINPVTPSLDQAKVALIIGPATASAGEIVALAFKERPNTIFIGEQSYGATTSNIQAQLPFESYMALTTAIDADRNGKVYDHVTPD